MTSQSFARRATTVAVAISVVFVASSLLAAPVSAKSSKPTMVIIGDSITWKYNNTVGSSNRGWWSYLGGKLKLKVIRHAERGSGYGKVGKNSDGTGTCTGTTFNRRLQKTSVMRDVKAAKVVLIAGGVNDYQTCYRRDGAWHLHASDPAHVKAQIVRTMTQLAKLRAHHKSGVYITAPYGPDPARAAAKAWIVPYIEAQAKAFGFTYIDTAHTTLAGNRTSDTVHPNAAGNVQMYRDLFNHSDIVRWTPGYKYVTAKPVPRPPTTSHPAP